MVTFCNRDTMALTKAVEPWLGRLDPEAYNDARIVAPGWAKTRLSPGRLPVTT